MSESNWHRALFVFFDKPERIDAFKQIEQRIPERDRYELFGSIWTNTESAFRNQRFLREFLTRPSKYKTLIMNREERAYLASLPEEIVIYRGATRRNRLGWSWSLQQSTAEWFAQRFPMGAPMVLQGVAKRADVIAYFDRRDEREILIDPKRVRVDKTIFLTAPRTTTMSRLVHQIHAYGNPMSDPLCNPAMAQMIAYSHMQNGNSMMSLFDQFEERYQFYTEFGFSEKAEQVIGFLTTVWNTYMGDSPIATQMDQIKKNIEAGRGSVADLFQASI